MKPSGGPGFCLRQRNSENERERREQARAREMYAPRAEGSHVPKGQQDSARGFNPG
jgi:hypothetical protein